MAHDREFEHAMQPARSGRRLVGSRRVLLAHSGASACDMLLSSIDRVLGEIDLREAISLDAGRQAVRQGKEALCFVCLDLPPRPHGAVDLAMDIQRAGLPLVLVARSLRWLPADATALRDVPWVSPEASDEEVSEALMKATHRAATRVSWESNGGRVRSRVP